MTDRRGVVTIRVLGRTGLLRLPDRRSTFAMAAGLLLVGVLMGVAIGPVAANSAGSAARQIIAVITGAGRLSVASAPVTPVSAADSGSSSTSGSSAGGAAASTSKAGNASPSSATAGGDSGSSASTITSDTSASGAPTATTPPPKLNLRGVVVTLDANSQGFVLVDPQHRLYEVHPDSATQVVATPKLGAAVRLATRKLANGTLASSRIVVAKKLRAPKSVVVEGVVSFVDRTHNRYALSTRGVSLLITAAPAPATTSPDTVPRASLLGALLGALLGGGRTHSGAPAPPGTPALPVLGHRLEVRLAVPAPVAPATAPGSPPAPAPPFQALKQTDRGLAPQPIELAGFTSAVEPASRTLTMSADGPGLSGASLVLHVPASIDIGKILAGESLVVHATVVSDGTYVMTGADADTGVTAADDATNALGDFRLPHHARERTSRG